MKPLERLAFHAARVQETREHRDRLIRELHPRFTIRAIAEAAHLSPARVHQIITKKEEPDAR